MIGVLDYWYIDVGSDAITDISSPSYEETCDGHCDARWGEQVGTCNSIVVQTRTGNGYARSYVAVLDGSHGATVYPLDAPAFIAEGEASSSAQILPVNLAKGNIYDGTPADPEPTDGLWQYALYYGNENLTCGGVSCNKRYFNVAVGFDATVPGCWLDFDATASDGTMFTDGWSPADTRYPIIHYGVQLTSNDGQLQCRQNPLNGAGSGVYAFYTTTDDPFQLCYEYDGATITDHCPVTPSYDYDAELDSGGGGP